MSLSRTSVDKPSPEQDRGPFDPARRLPLVRPLHSVAHAALFSLIAAALGVVLVSDRMPLWGRTLWFTSVGVAVFFPLLGKSLLPASPRLGSAGFRWAIGSGAALLEGASWALALVLAPALEVPRAAALTLVVAALCFPRLGNLSVGRGDVWLGVAPILLAQTWVFANRGSLLDSPILLVWLALCTLGGAARILSQNHFTALNHEAKPWDLSALQQRQLLDGLTVGVLITRGGIVEHCNERLLQMFGYERAEVIGQEAEALLAVPAGAATEAPTERSRLPSNVSTITTQRRRRDGVLIEVELTTGFVGTDDDLGLVVSVYQDVSQTKLVERELRLSRERLRLALDALQSGVWDVDLNEARYFLSRRFKTILGFPERVRIPDSLGRLFFHHEFIHALDRERIAQARMVTLRDGAPFDEQYRIVRDNRSFWVRETVVALCDVAGTPYRFTGSLTDTTTINEIQERLRASEAFHRNLIEASNALIWCTDLLGVLTFVNERGARELYGYEASEMIGRAATEFVVPEFQERLMLAMARPLKQGAPIRNLELVQPTSGPQRIFVSVNAVPMFDATGAVEGVMGITTDITHLKKRERAFQDATRLQRLIFDSAGEGIVLVRNQRIYRANQAFADLVGGTIGDLVARPLSQWFIDAEHWERVEEQLARLGHVVKVEAQLIPKSGAPLWISVTGRRADMTEHGAIYIWVCADISASKAQQQQSWYRAHHDELTGLANRRLLQDHLEQTTSRARRESTRAALFVLDLDGFKAINDAHGHAFGDEVLKEVANRLTDNVRALDLAARLGGDEFVVVLHEVGTLQDVELMAQRLIAEVGRPIATAGRTVSLSTSIGIALFPDESEGITGLMQAADLAMYAAKALGNGRFQFALQRSEAPTTQRL